MLSDRHRFMRDHAGYVIGERATGALGLARAEQLLEEAIDLELATVDWEWDDTPYECDLDPEQVQAKFDSNEWTGPFGCVVTVGEESRSLWGIVLNQWGTNDPYARVIVAELASELTDDLRQSIGDHYDSLASSLI